eukprot:sb/3464648/
MFTGFTLLLMAFAHARSSKLAQRSAGGESEMGIQHDYDMVRAICYCQIAQGITGFIYHLCPNESGESLSNVFLLLSISFLCLKIHQNRHPDTRHLILQPLCVTVFSLGLHGLITVATHRESLATWVIFGLVHIALTFSVPLQFVLLGSAGIAFRPVQVYRNMPMLGMKVAKLTTVQVVVGVVGITSNIFTMAAAMAFQPSNFSLYLIPVFVGNMLLFLGYYLATKPLTDHIVELCPLTLSKDDKGKPIPLPQTVQVTIRANEPVVKEGKNKVLDVQVDFKDADHIDIVPDKWTNRYNLDERESLVYRYTWPVGDKALKVDEVDILVKWADKDGKIAAGKGPDVCASVSLRFGECPLETMGVSGLTFTRQAFFTVNKHDKSIKNVKHANESFLIEYLQKGLLKFTSSRGLRLDSPGRTKTVQILVTERKKESQVEFFILPVFTALLIIA